MFDTRLYLIDATAFCYRAFYAIQGLSTSFGQPTGAVYGFVRMLQKILKEHKPGLIAVCFDVSRDTFRAKKYAEYKLQRPSMPDGLSSQMPFIKEIVTAYGLKLVEKEGFEADDIIATLSREAAKKGMQTLIISADKDILQLVDSRTKVFSPHKEAGINYDEKTVKAKFGLEPKQIPELLALMGDSIDNIPNVPGVGEKTAVALIKEFGSVEGLLKHVDKVPKEGLRQSIREHAQLIKLNRELVQLCSDVKLDVDIEDLACKEQDTAELYKIFKSLEFKRLLSDLPVSGEKLPSLKLEQGVPDGLIKEGGELLVSGSSLETLVFYCAGKAFKANLKQTTQILADSKIKKSGYDLKGLKVSLSHEGAKIQGFHSDAMIAAYLINPSAGDYSLAALARDYLDKHLSREALSPAESIGLIAKILPKLEEGLAERSLKDLFVNMEMPLVGVLADMEIAGVKLDLKLLLDLSVQLERRLKTLIKEIYNISGSEFNINSPKQLGEVLFEKLKLPVVKKTKTGFSTDEEVLKKLAREHELPKFLLEYRQLTKLKTTYIDTLPELADKEGSRLHTSFNQTGTETGRLSSSNPNLQNIPVKTEVGRSIRQAITSSGKGYYLLSCDYSQVELRILAHLSRDRELVEAFKKGKDIHKATAALVNGIPEEEVTDEMRELAKRVNFGIVYGQTGFGLSRDLGISLGEAQGFIDEYFARYPGVKDYVEEQMRKAQEDGFVTTISGRRRYLPEIKSKNMGLRQFAQRQAVNTPLQGSAADLIKLAMIDIARSLEGLKLKSQMVLQIHDELLFDVPEDELDEMAKLVREKMEHVLKLSIPLKVDIKKGRNWLEMDSV